MRFGFAQQRFRPELLNGLTLWYPMHGSFAPFDLSKSGKNASFTGTPVFDPVKFYPRQIGGGFQTSSGNYITTSIAISNFISSTGGSVAVWYFPTGTPTTSTTVYQGDYIVGETGGYFGLNRSVFSSVDTTFAFIWDGAAKSVSFATIPNVLTHLVLTYDGSTLSLYVNAMRVGTASSGAPQNLGSTCQIGSGYQNRNFTGTLSDVRIYNRELTAGEVLELYDNPFCPEETDFETLQAAAAGGFFSRYYYDMPAGNRLMA